MTRDEMVAKRIAGMSIGQIASLAGVSKSTVHYNVSEEQREKQKLRTSKKTHKKKQMLMVIEYLLSHPCECGESDPAALEFDHDDPTKKHFTVSQCIGWYADERLFSEMAKCTVRCANCHRKRTAKQFGWYQALVSPDGPNVLKG